MKAALALCGIALLVAVLAVVDFFVDLFAKPLTEEQRKRAAGHNPYHGPFA